jgi:hypothetical protein
VLLTFSIDVLPLENHGKKKSPRRLQFTNRVLICCLHAWSVIKNYNKRKVRKFGYGKLYNDGKLYHNSRNTVTLRYPSLCNKLSSYPRASFPNHHILQSPCFPTIAEPTVIRLATKTSRKESATLLLKEIHRNWILLKIVII